MLIYVYIVSQQRYTDNLKVQYIYLTVQDFIFYICAKTNITLSFNTLATSGVYI